MPARFHINPDTGDVRACSAEKRCRFGENVPHYSNSEEARSAYEQSQGTQSVTHTRKTHTIKNLISSVFTRRITPELSQVEETVDSLLTDTVIASENGGFNVVVNDSYLGVIEHKFGDLIIDQEIAERLHKADPKKDYQLGECGVLAGELWNLSEHVDDYYIIKTDSDPVIGTHHFVRLKNGTIVDSQGLWTEEAFTDYWKSIDSTSQISTFDLDDDDVVKNPEFTVSKPELFNILKDLIDQHVDSTS